jgi:hypothetical protein
VNKNDQTSLLVSLFLSLTDNLVQTTRHTDSNMQFPSNEELWLLCLKGKCVQVNDKGLDLLQKSFRHFFKKMLTISTTLAEHNSRATIIQQDVIQSQEILFRQRENNTIRMSGMMMYYCVTPPQQRQHYIYEIIKFED